MKIKVITLFLLCFLFINSCSSSYRKEIKVFLVTSLNKAYDTNCKKYYDLPRLIMEAWSDSCDVIYLKEDKFSILHKGKLYHPAKVQGSKDYVIRIYINKLKEDKEAKAVYADNTTSSLTWYEERESFSRAGYYSEEREDFYHEKQY